MQSQPAVAHRRRADPDSGASRWPATEGIDSSGCRCLELSLADGHDQRHRHHTFLGQVFPPDRVAGVHGGVHSGCARSSTRTFVRFTNPSLSDVAVPPLRTKALVRAFSDQGLLVFGAGLLTDLLTSASGWCRESLVQGALLVDRNSVASTLTLIVRRVWTRPGLAIPALSKGRRSMNRLWTWRPRRSRSSDRQRVRTDLSGR